MSRRLRLSPKGSPWFKRPMPPDSATNPLFYSKRFAGCTGLLITRLRTQGLPTFASLVWRLLATQERKPVGTIMRNFNKSPTMISARISHDCEKPCQLQTGLRPAGFPAGRLSTCRRQCVPIRPRAVVPATSSALRNNRPIQRKGILEVTHRSQHCSFEAAGRIIFLVPQPWKRTSLPSLLP